jgi:hypothetical protein
MIDNELSQTDVSCFRWWWQRRNSRSGTGSPQHPPVVCPLRRSPNAMYYHFKPDIKADIAPVILQRLSPLQLALYT